MGWSATALLSRFASNYEESAAVCSVSFFFFRSYFDGGGLFMCYKVEVKEKKNPLKNIYIFSPSPKIARNTPLFKDQ